MKALTYRITPNAGHGYHWRRHVSIGASTHLRSLQRHAVHRQDPWAVRNNVRQLLHVDVIRSRRLDGVVDVPHRVIVRRPTKVPVPRGVGIGKVLELLLVD